MKPQIDIGRCHDLTGQHFGDLTVLEPWGKDDRGVEWLCECLRCGGKAIVRAGALKNGNTKSCGCLVIDFGLRVIEKARRRQAEVQTLIRRNQRSEVVIQTEPTPGEICQILRDVIAKAAANGQPFSKCGRPGVYERRSELPEGVRFGQAKLENFVERMLRGRTIVRTTARGLSRPIWLDIPGGALARIK